MPRQKLTRARRPAAQPAGRLAPGRRTARAARPRTRRELVVPIRRQKLAYVSTWDGYAMDRTIGRPAADISLLDLATGDANQGRRPDRRRRPAGQPDRPLPALPRTTITTGPSTPRTRAVTNITKAAATSFIDRESDATVKQKPPFGVAGWTKNDDAVLLYDKFDVWAGRAPDGSTSHPAHRRHRRTGAPPLRPARSRRRVHRHLRSR